MDIASTAASSQIGSAVAKSKLTGNYETFLKLLTQQLQHQDPTKPMDTADFTQQLVQYSQVEQQISTNANLESLLSLQRAAAGATSVGYLGKTVVTKGDLASLNNGAANWTYELPTSAAEAQMLVTDAKGRVVFTGNADRAAGKHVFNWDGKNQNGAQLPDGIYKLEIKAKDAQGLKMTPSLSSSGLVTETDLSKSDPMLTIGARKVALADVIAIKAQ